MGEIPQNLNAYETAFIGKLLSGHVWPSHI